LNVKKEKLDEWLKKGALITDGVKKLLKWNNYLNLY
jgi:ribosomal protein S16